MNPLHPVTPDWQGLTSLPEKAMAPHSSTLAWRIPWMEEPGRLQSMGSHRVRHDWVTSLSLFTFMHWRRKWQPTPVFLPGENPREGRAWWAAVYGVTQSWTRLKQLSSRLLFISPLPPPPKIIAWHVVRGHNHLSDELSSRFMQSLRWSYSLGATENSSLI